MALSQQALQAVLSSSTGQTFLECLTIEHPDIDTLRLVNDKQNLTRTEGEFIRFPFSVTAPEQSQDTPPTIDITADIVDRRVLTEIRSLAGKRSQGDITYEAVLADSPNTVEFGPSTFKFESVSTNGLTSATIKGTFLLGALNDAFPARQFAPSNAG